MATAKPEKNQSLDSYDINVASFKEYWSKAEESVIVEIPFSPESMLESQRADEFHASVAAAVKAIKNGVFGACIPKNLEEAPVQILVKSKVPVGKLTQHRVDLLTKKLGIAIPLTVEAPEAA